MNLLNHVNMTMRVHVDGVEDWRPYEILGPGVSWLSGPAPVPRDGERREQMVDGTWYIVGIGPKR